MNKPQNFGSLKQSLILMSEYNAWTTYRLLQDIEKIKEEEYKKNMNSFFGSIHGTLTHLYMADMVWYCRMKDGSQSGFEHMWGSNTEKWMNYYNDFSQVRQLMENQVDNWKDFVKNVDEKALEAKFQYKNTKDQPQEAVLATQLYHLFNHGTHHRGQITTLIYQLGYKYQDVDLTYMPGKDNFFI